METQFHQQSLNMVVAIDLSKSVGTKGPDGRTDFEKNVEAVDKILSEVPADSRVTVIGITDRSFSEPYVLLSARIPADSGYFGERLAAAHRQLLQAWHTRSGPLQPKFESSDIFGMFSLAAEILRSDPAAKRKLLVIFSDMRQHTVELDLETSVREFGTVGRRVAALDLTGVDVHILGVDGAGKNIQYWEGLREFWRRYLVAAGASLGNYSTLREMHSDFK